MGNINNNFQLRTKASGVLKFGLASLLASTVVATAQAQNTNTIGFTIEEVIVSARKKLETVKDIPISISTFTPEAIEKSNITSLDDVAALTPGLIIQDFGAGALKTPTIRGLAQTNAAGFENNVSVFIDGVFLPSRNNFDLGFINLERIEVARGPQSALYGRNTFAGAINYITRKPSYELSGNAKVTVGTHDKEELTASIEGPIVSDVLSFRVALARDEFGGTFDARDAGGLRYDLQGHETENAYVGLFYTPTDDLLIEVTGLYNDSEQDADAWFAVENNCGDFFCGDLPTREVVSLDREGTGFDNELSIAAINIEYEMGDFTLTSLSSYVDSESSALTDTDYVAGNVPIVSAFFPAFVVGAEGRAFSSRSDNVESISEELRLSFDDGGMIQGSVGVFYYDEERIDVISGAIDDLPSAAFPLACGIFGAQFCSSVSGSLLASANSDLNLVTQDIEVFAIFGQISIDITDKIALGLEARYTEEDKDFEEVLFRFNPPNPENVFEEEFNYFTPRVTINYDLSEEVTFYVSYAEGVKSGGFNLTDSIIEAERFFDEESNATIEVGAKTRLMGGRLQGNVALFYVDWEDMQISSPSEDENAFGSVVRNVGSATSYGIEVDALYAITEYITWSFTYAFANPEFDDDVEDAASGSICIASGECAVNPLNNAADVGGNQVGRTVKNQFTTSIDVEAPLTNDLDWYWRVDYTYQDESPIRSTNLQFLPSREIVNTRFGITHEDYKFSFWAKNLFDEEYARSALRQPIVTDFSSPTAVLQGDGRTLGITGEFFF